MLAQLQLGGRRAQSLIVTLGLLPCSALLVHVSDGLPESYFHFFVMVAALSLYEDWVPFGAAVAFVLIQQGITAAIVDYDRAELAVAVGARALGVHRRAERRAASSPGARPSATARRSARSSSRSRRAC